MRVSSYAVARPAYYDRNASSTIGAYVFTVAPHANVVRWTVTVASGKKLLIEGGICTHWAITAPSVAAARFGLIRVNNGSNDFDVAFAMGISATLNLQFSDKATTIATVYAGETVAGTTGDASTGGTVFFDVGIKGTTFDA